MSLPISSSIPERATFLVVGWGVGPASVACASWSGPWLGEFLKSLPPRGKAGKTSFERAMILALRQASEGGRFSSSWQGLHGDAGAEAGAAGLDPSQDLANDALRSWTDALRRRLGAPGDEWERGFAGAQNFELDPGGEARRIPRAPGALAEEILGALWSQAEVRGLLTSARTRSASAIEASELRQSAHGEGGESKILRI